MLCLGTVDEHFAKALGSRTWQQIQVTKDDQTTRAPAARTSPASTRDVILPNSVDEHFAKALGSTWLRLRDDTPSGSSHGVLK